MDSPKDHSSGKNKRKWKEEEDDALIEVLKDLVNGGMSFKADNGFKPGFLNTVAEKHKAKLPESNLKAQPHVHSRLQHCKGIYNVDHDMVVGSYTRGFWMGPKNKVSGGRERSLKAYGKVSSFNLIFWFWPLVSSFLALTFSVILFCFWPLVFSCFGSDHQFLHFLVLTISFFIFCFWPSVSSFSSSSFSILDLDYFGVKTNRILCDLVLVLTLSILKRLEIQVMSMIAG